MYDGLTGSSIHHTLARYCESVLKATKPVNGKAKIRPLGALKPLDQSWQKLAWVTMSWTSLGMLNFIALPSGVFASILGDFPYHLGWLVFKAFLGFCNLLQPTPLNGFLWKIHQKMSFWPRMCLLESRWPQLIFRPLNFWKKTQFSEPILTGLSFFVAENRFNMEMLQYKLPLIVIVAP